MNLTTYTNKKNKITLEMKGISKSFPGVKALKDVSIKLYSTEVLSIMGQNGAGKSTLMNILGGIIKKDNGEIFINGKRSNINSPNDAKKMGIAYIHQELTIFNNLTVAENFSFQKYDVIKPFWIINYKKVYEKCREILNQIDPTIKLTTKVGELSIGQKQIVEISRAIGSNASILIFDEPTSSLSLKEKEKLFKLIDYLKNKGYSIIYITHLLEEMFSISDRVYVLRDGTLTNEFLTKSIKPKDLIKAMLGKYVDKHQNIMKPVFGPDVLSVENIESSSGIKDISFTLKSGEILGIWGLLGSGRTELMRSIIGLAKLMNGKVKLKVNGKWEKVGNDFTKYFGYVPENRREEGLFLPLSAQKNISIGKIRDISNILSMINREKEKSLVNKLIKKLKIKVSSSKQRVETLSGGNQQKIVLSRWLLFKPKVFILDDPNKGLDIGAKEEVFNIINKLAEDGVAIIFISSDINEILDISHKIIVLANKRMIGTLDSKDANKEILMRNAMGLE